MNKTLALFATIVGIVIAASSSDLDAWNNYKMEYSKHYQNESEDQYRMDIFLEHKKEIDEHNERFDKGEVTYKMGFNKYSDLSTDEFRSRMNGFKQPDVLQSVQGAVAEERDFFVGSPAFSLPKSVDWRKEGAVTEVKDQRDCGSCWAFAATGAIEGQHYLKKSGPLVSLSEQDLIDCASISLINQKYFNLGCEGGVVDEAYKFVRDNGIIVEKSYPYIARDGICIHRLLNSSNVTIHGFKDIPRGNERMLQEVLATVGPVAAAIDASHKSFQHYHSGIYDEPKCSSKDFDHSVLIVGYGTESDGREYYIVKNCWGPNWGEHGYIRMPRNQQNHCAIASYANYPIV